MISPPRTGIHPVVPPVSESWRVIGAWLAKHVPDQHAALRPPASLDAIGRAEERLGFALPTDLRESLLCHDGEDLSHEGALPCGPLYSTERLVEVRDLRMNCWEPEEPDDSPWWGELWVPFAGSDGDEHFIDASEGTWRNHLGRAAHDDSAYFTGWPSLGAWLHGVAEAMSHHEDRERIYAVDRPMLPGDGTVDW